MKKVIFFNFWGNGDVFLCKEFVRWIINNIKADEYIYFHKYPSFFRDIPNISEQTFCPVAPKYISPYNGCVIADDILYINTWYNACGGIHFPETGISIQTLMKVFTYQLKLIGYDLPQDMYLFIPKIDYSYWEVKDFNTDKRKIFVSNGEPRSGHAVPSTNFIKAVKIVARKHKECVFLSTNDKDDTIDNYIYTKDIHHYEGKDLVHNAYLAKDCDVILGKFSGTHSFCYNTDIMGKKKNLLFTSMPSNCWYWGLDKYKDFYFNFGGNDVDQIVNFIEENL